MITPPISKADQSGEIHCPFPVYLTFETDHINAAAAILDIEHRVGADLSDDERRTTALFHDSVRQPYEHHFLHRMLRLVLTHLYSAETASLFSFHSYRAGLATVLHAAGVPDDMIQPICRWMCLESLRRYRVVGLREHERFINGAVGASVDSIQAGNVPKVANNIGFARMLSELVEDNSREALRHARQFDQASIPVSQPGGPSCVPPATHTQPTPPPAPQAALLPALQPAKSPQPGDQVVISAQAWPTLTCAEFQGLGWAATVKRTSSTACRITFDVAHTRDGRPYADSLVPLCFIFAQPAHTSAHKRQRQS